MVCRVFLCRSLEVGAISVQISSQVRRGDGDQQDDNYNDDDDDNDILDSAHEHDNSDGSDSGELELV